MSTFEQWFGIVGGILLAAIMFKGLWGGRKLKRPDNPPAVSADDLNRLGQ